MIKRAGPHPNHVKRVVMAITFSSNVHFLSTALMTVTVPSGATTFSALQKSAIVSKVLRPSYGVAAVFVQPSMTECCKSWRAQTWTDLQCPPLSMRVTNSERSDLWYDHSISLAMTRRALFWRSCD